MSAADVQGLEAWQARLTKLAAANGLKDALHSEAQALAQDAAQRLREQPSARSGTLADAVNVTDVSRGDMVGFVIGTENPGGFDTEFGTTRQVAQPWLIPALQMRVAAIRAAIGNVFSAS